MTKIFLFKKRTSLIFLILSLLCLATTVVLITQYLYTTRSQIQSARKLAQQQVKSAAKQIDDFLALLKPIAHTLADELSKKRFTKEELEKRLQQKPIEIFGFNVVFLPYAFDPNVRLYAPLFFERDGKEKLIFIENEYDYTESKHNWYHKPLKEKAAGWIPHYYGQASRTILIEYAVPFYFPENPKKIMGIVYTNQSVAHLKHVISTLYLGPTGYWFLLAKDGTFLSHPHDYLITEEKTIFDMGAQLNEKKLDYVGQQVDQGKPAFVEYKNEINNAPSWLIAEPIPTTDWSICGVFDPAELPMEVNKRRHQLIHIVLSILLFFIFALCFSTQFFAPRQPLLWLLSSTISTLLAFSIGSIWHVTSLYPDFKGDLQILENKAHLYKTLREMSPKVMEKVEREIPKAPKTLGKEALISRRYLTQELMERLTYRFETSNHISTGVFVSHLLFATEGQIEFVGYIWQHYHYKLHKDITQGFELPQAKSSAITEVYRKKGMDSETIMWRVQATLNQELTYQDYPFDVKDLEIQIWHKDFEKNITLIPDFDAYKLLNPRAKPAISSNIYMPGWNVKSGAFAYKKNIYTTTFGMYDFGPFGTYQQVEKSAIPELYFNIKVQRQIMDTLISDLLPLGVIALLLFLVLLMSFTQGYAIVAGSGSIFFSTVFAQVRFRSKIPTGQIVYFENFFLIAYGAILAVVIVSMLYMLGFHLGFLQYKKNLISKLLYWPLFLGALTIITLAYLY